MKHDIQLYVDQDPIATLSIFTVTDQGRYLAHQLSTLLQNFKVIVRSLDELEHAFKTDEVLLFIMATGIVVRKIAPYIEHKAKDPAVLVMDQAGQYIISLLSGHLGGANHYACYLANRLADIGYETKPVITTATDVEGVPAIDEFAQKIHAAIVPVERIKLINQALVHHQIVPVYVEESFKQMVQSQIRALDAGDHLHLQDLATFNFQIDKIKSDQSHSQDSIDYAHDHRSLYQSVWRPVVSEQMSTNVMITTNSDRILTAPANTLCLVPKCMIVGIGCKADTSAEVIQDAVIRCCQAVHIDPHAIMEAASITLKAHEPGLLAWSKQMQIPIRFFDSETLKLYEPFVKTSDFVRQVAGVGAVSSVCALKAADDRLALMTQTDRLLNECPLQARLKTMVIRVEKFTYQGVTCSLIQMPWQVMPC